MPPSAEKVAFVDATVVALTSGPFAPSTSAEYGYGGEIYGHDFSVDHEDAVCAALDAWYTMHGAAHPEVLIRQEARRFDEVADGHRRTHLRPGVDVHFARLVRTILDDALDLPDAYSFRRDPDRLLASAAVALYVADQLGGTLVAVDLDAHDVGVMPVRTVPAHQHVYNLLDDDQIVDLTRAYCVDWKPTGVPYGVSRDQLLADDTVADMYGRMRP